MISNLHGLWLWPCRNDAAQARRLPFGVAIDRYEELFREARQCMNVSGYTAVVLSCRKILKSLAIARGARRGQRMSNYVHYLCAQGDLPGELAHDVADLDQVAEQELRPMSRADAERMMTLVGQTLSGMKRTS